jgi:pimeloyl-ACP methyl ester carboxylesterase
VIRRVAAASLAGAVSMVTLRAVTRRGGDRLMAAPRTIPEEAALGPALDALGGEVVRLRARDGLRLAGRWLPAEQAGSSDGPDPSGAWRTDPREAILLLHGWSGSCAPDLVEYGPFLRQTAGVLGLDFRGHGLSDAGPTTFGLLEVEDVAGALDWLGERGIERVALVGMSMGATTAIAAVTVLGDGSLPGVDADLAAPAHVAPPRRPRIVAVVADSVGTELAIPIASRLRGPQPGRLFVAHRLLDAATRTLGADPRATEPGRVIGLLEGTPILLISGDADSTVPIDDARRLAALAPAGTRHLEVAGAEHGRAHAVDPTGYAAAVTEHLRSAFASHPERGPILHAPGQRSAGAPEPARAHQGTPSVED